MYRSRVEEGVVVRLMALGAVMMLSGDPGVRWI